MRRRDRARQRRRPQDRHGSGLLSPFAILALLAALIFTPAHAASIESPVPFVVNEYATGTQIQPAVQALADGGFVVVWTSNFQDGYGLGVFGRVFDDAGGPLGSEFQVNGHTSCDQFAPAVAQAGDGFVVAWHSGPTFTACTQDGSGFGVFARVFDAAAAPLSEEFQVNAFTTYGQANPAVTGGTDGFAVVWDGDAQDGDGIGVFARSFSSDATVSTPEFRVNAQTTGDQYRPAVTALDDGFAVVWLDAQDAGPALDVFVRRFDSGGVAIGTDVLVSQGAPIERGRPLIARHGAGIAALWSDLSDESDYDVVGRLLGLDGIPAGETFQVNTFTTNRQALTGAAANRDGFVVVWNSLHQDGDSEGVFGRRLGDEARPVGPEFAVSAYTLGEQSAAAVTSLADGGFVIAWSSPADASEYAIVAARFDPDHALAECGDADASGTITARDALLVLRSAIGADACTLPACDVNNDAQLTTTDALTILRRALNLPIELNCAPA